MHFHTNDRQSRSRVPSLQRHSAVYQHLQPVQSRTSEQEPKGETNQTLNNPAINRLWCLNLPEWKYTTSILNLTHSKPI